MEKEIDIAELMNCGETELREKLKLLPAVPSTDFLHKLLHEAIKRDQYDSAILIACIIQNLVVEDSKRAAVWEAIQSGKTSLPTTTFQWEKYFAMDIRRRKKKNEKLRNESILHLYNAKQLSLFKAKHYPKLFTTLIKLGADPFEMKDSRRHTKTNLTFAILKSRSMSKSATIKVMEFMAKNNLISLEPGLRKKAMTSPFRIALSGKKYCLKYLVQASGPENEKVYDVSILQSLGRELNPLLPYFRPELAARIFSQVVTPKGDIMLSLLHLKPEQYSQDFHKIIKLMVKADPSIVPKLKHLVDPQYLFFLTTKKTAAKCGQYFSGETQFDVTALPTEIMEMIAIYLDPEEEILLFSASKSLRLLMKDRWGFLTWRNFPTLYKQLENKTNITWQEKIIPTLKSSPQWKSGNATVKSLKMPKTATKIVPLLMNEFWLASGNSNRILLYNLTDDSHQILPGKLMEEARQIHFLNPSPYEPPALLFRTFEYFGCWVNNQMHTAKYSFLDGRMLAKLSDERFMVSSNQIYDMNLQQIVPANIGFNLTYAKLNPFNNTLVARTLDDLLILDTDLKVLANVPGKNLAATTTSGFTKLEFLDEYTLMSSDKDTFITDIRTFKPLYRVPELVVRYNGAGRGLSLQPHHNTVTIWNLRTMSQENVVPCPNGFSISELVCNSRMAVFAVKPNMPSCLSFESV